MAPKEARHPSNDEILNPGSGKP
eukprot:SAG31_NODE_42416_length_271_cov_1.767442_1_plen_22_part_01